MKKGKTLPPLGLSFSGGDRLHIKLRGKLYTAVGETIVSDRDKAPSGKAVEMLGVGLKRREGTAEEGSGGEPCR